MVSLAARSPMTSLVSIKSSRQPGLIGSERRDFPFLARQKDRRRMEAFAL